MHKFSTFWLFAFFTNLLESLAPPVIRRFMFHHIHVDNAKSKKTDRNHQEAIFELRPYVSSFMNSGSFKLLLLSALLLLGRFSLFGQDKEPFTCFNAQEVLFPLDQNDFSSSQILKDDAEVNALYYLYQDKYSFWYKFISTSQTTIEFVVSPSNKEDRYRAVAYKYGKSDFCEKLVNDNIEPLDLQRAAIFTDGGEILYRNKIEVAAGDTFYVSVLSLNNDDCGHLLKMKCEGDELTFHAVHRPCYNFGYLDIPDFGTAKLPSEDVEMGLVFEEKRDTATFVDSAPAQVDLPEVKPFAAIKTIEVQNSDDGFVTVGDKLILNQVFFYNNTYAFKPEAESELNQLTEFMMFNETIEIEIQGHTANNSEDIVPDPNFKGQGKEWNFKGNSMQLSEKRAEAVKAYLVQRGVDKKRLKTVGYGDTRKRVPNASTFEESEKNMRVEVLIIKE
jgi:outer membrane protein OmpA-like peptidoglycan-associated protein